MPVVAASPRAALHPLIADRVSPRSFDPTHRLEDDRLHVLLEAARWAPSSGNRQPWRLAVARRGSRAHEAILATLNAGNRRWAGDASALVVAVAEHVREGRAMSTAQYDLGLAVAQLSMQANAMDLHVRQMGGFDKGALGEALGLDENLAPVVVVAVGRRGASQRLPGDLQERERAPRVRRPLAESVLAVDGVPFEAEGDRGAVAP